MSYIWYSSCISTGTQTLSCQWLCWWLSCLSYSYIGIALCMGVSYSVTEAMKKIYCTGLFISAIFNHYFLRSVINDYYIVIYVVITVQWMVNEGIYYFFTVSFNYVFIIIIILALLWLLWLSWLSISPVFWYVYSQNVNLYQHHNTSLLWY